MTENYELIVKGIRNFENKVAVTVALRGQENALTVKFLTWTSRWTVLKVPRWSYIRGSSQKEHQTGLPGS